MMRKGRTSHERMAASSGATSGGGGITAIGYLKLGCPMIMQRPDAIGVAGSDIWLRPALKQCLDHSYVFGGSTMSNRVMERAAPIAMSIEAGHVVLEQKLQGGKMATAHGCRSEASLAAAMLPT